MDKLEFSLPQDAKTQFKLIRLTGFRKTDFQKSYSIYSFQPQSRFLKKNYLRMLPHKFQFILQAGFWEDDIKGFVSLYSFVKLNPTSFPFLAYPIPRDHDLNKLYLPSLMMRRVLEKTILKKNSLYSYAKINHSSIEPLSNPGGTWFEEIWIYAT